MMLKIGDKVIGIRSGRLCVIIEISTQDLCRVRWLDTKGTSIISSNMVTLEEIYNSPLYQTMKEQDDN